jgi:hypothetical protein
MFSAEQMALVRQRTSRSSPSGSAVALTVRTPAFPRASGFVFFQSFARPSTTTPALRPGSAASTPKCCSLVRSFNQSCRPRSKSIVFQENLNHSSIHSNMTPLAKPAW